MVLIGVLIIILMTFIIANFNEKLMIDSTFKNKVNSRVEKSVEFILGIYYLY